MTANPGTENEQPDVVKHEALPGFASVFNLVTLLFVFYLLMVFLMGGDGGIDASGGHGS